MPVENVVLEDIIVKRLQQETVLTTEESALFEQWIAVGTNRALFAELENSHILHQQLTHLHSFEKKKQSAKDKLIEEFIAAGTPVVAISNKKVFPKYLAAAIVVPVALSIGAYYYFVGTSKKATTAETKVQQVDVLPAATDMATLTLADGTKVSLDNANGLISQQGNIQVTKLASGELVYKVSGALKIPANTISYNTLSTARSGKQHIQLPDGTHVWLNSATDLTYPTSFRNTKERIVTVTGEAYFEVAKDASKPFKVKLVTSAGEKGTIEVLGTHFNVNAYSDEPSVKTTLLEGRVKITNSALSTQHSQFLSPGQQAILSNDNINIESNTETEQVMAWRNGMIWFEKTDLKTALREVSRAYDVDIEYKGQVNSTENLRFRVPKTIALSKVLEALKQALGKNYNLDFTIVPGNKVIVTGDK